MTMTVTQLFCYPLKGARGFSVDVMSIGRLGPQYDRQWLVVDEHGMFVAQRSSKGLGIGIREMCLIEVSFEDDLILFNAPGMPELHMPRKDVSYSRFAHEVEVQVWKQRTVGTELDDNGIASRWFTEFLSQFKPGTYRLVRMPDNGNRPAKRGDAHLSYADSYPFLVTSQPSLDDLNRRIAERKQAAGEPVTEPIGWDRFRPNIVIDGCKPYFEDEVDLLGHGTSLVLEGQVLCVRCPVPATNQQTAKLGKEPLKTLATYRRLNPGNVNEVMFGRNFNHRGIGEIRIGDEFTANY